MDKENNGFHLTVDENKCMKHFYSVDDLIEELMHAEENPLAFNPNELLFAKEFFTYTNYYSFSIYRKQLPSNPDVTYSFSDCMELYRFNYFLRESLNKFTGYVELMLKASFVKSLCQNYEGNLQTGECYLDSKLYINTEVFDEAIRILDHRVVETKSLPIAHHLKNKCGKIPLWVLMPELTFGETTGLLSSMKDSIKRQWIEDSFLATGRINSKIYGQELQSKMFSWFSASWYLRNRCAHYARLYGCNFNVGTPSFFSEDMRRLKKQGKKKTHNRDLFAYMLAIKNLLTFHSLEVQAEWNTFLNGIDSSFKKNPAIILPRKIGFPDTWKDFLIID